jgi:hypothetical protein
METQFLALDEAELLGFFGTEPTTRAVDEGYWCYEISDESGITVRFSFDLYERSVQTTILHGGSQIAMISHEGADRMLLHDRTLRCEFSTRGEKATLTVETGLRLSVIWSSLRTE